MANLMKMVDGSPIEMTDDEQFDFLAQQAIDNNSSAIELLKTQAKTALDKSDITMSRIAEGVARGNTTWSALDVIAVLDFRETLRPIAKNGTGEIPPQPAHPSGT